MNDQNKLECLYCCSVKQVILQGRYNCTIDLLFDWFELVCFASKNKNCQYSYSWFQTSQTVRSTVQWCPPFCIPCVKGSLLYLQVAPTTPSWKTSPTTPPGPGSRTRASTTDEATLRHNPDTPPVDSVKLRQTTLEVAVVNGTCSVCCVTKRPSLKLKTRHKQLFT